MAGIGNEDSLDAGDLRLPMLDHSQVGISGPVNDESSDRQENEADDGDVEFTSLEAGPLADGDSPLVSSSISWVNKRMYRLFLMASPLCVWYRPTLGSSIAGEYDDDQIVDDFKEWIDKICYFFAFVFLLLGLCCGFPGCISSSSRELVSLTESIGQRFQAIFRGPYSFLPR